MSETTALDRAPQPLVCILGGGDWQRTNRAVASARRFGLAVAVGDTGQAARGAPDGDASVAKIAWRDDFAAARNQLIAAVREGSDAAAPYLLWLDSDEELIAWPTVDWRAQQAPWYLLMIQDRDDLTPRPIARLHRNDPAIAWRHAIHEKIALPTGRPAPPPTLLPGAALRHAGYDSDSEVARKLERNAQIVARERAQGQDYYGLALEEARHRDRRGSGATLAWSRAFNYHGAGPRRAGSIDPRVEPASALCEFGQVEPALGLLAQNPQILDLQLAVLQAGYRATGAVDRERLDFLADCARTGLADWRYSFPRALLDADREAILALVTSVGRQSESERPTLPGDATNLLSGDAMTIRFRRSQAVDAETLGDALVLMNTGTGEVLTLNHTARAVWEALAEEPSVEDLIAGFAAVFRDVDQAALRQDIADALERLRAAGLALESGAEQ